MVFILLLPRTSKISPPKEPPPKKSTALARPHRAKAVIFIYSLQFNLDKNNAIALFYTHFQYALPYGWVWRYSTTAFSSS